MTVLWELRGLRRLALATVLLCLPAVALAAEINCADGLDDDFDSDTDCQDDDCDLDPACGVSAARSLDVVRDDPSDDRTNWVNVYLVSWPEVPDIRDVANTGAREPDKCVGHPFGPTSPDGILDSTDMLCTLWDQPPLAAPWSISVHRAEPATCRQTYHMMAATGFGGISFAGDTFLLDRVEGYLISVSSNSTSPPNPFPVTLAGWHDHSWRGTRIEAPSPSCRPALVYLHLPFDMLERTADEILCGLVGVDWWDGNGDGDPDSCSGGIFDGFTPISVETYDNDPSDAPTSDARTNNYPVSRAVVATDRGLVFLGPNFDLKPGDAVLVQVRDDQQARTFYSWRR